MAAAINLGGSLDVIRERGRTEANRIQRVRNNGEERKFTPRPWDLYARARLQRERNQAWLVHERRAVRKKGHLNTHYASESVRAGIDLGHTRRLRDLQWWNCCGETQLRTNVENSINSCCLGNRSHKEIEHQLFLSYEPKQYIYIEYMIILIVCLK